MNPIPPINLIDPGSDPRPRPKKIQIKLADGKERTIQHMMSTSFWHPDGTPMSAQQFMESLYGKFPDFFHDEAELRTLWSSPDKAQREQANVLTFNAGTELSVNHSASNTLAADVPVFRVPVELVKILDRDLK